MTLTAMSEDELNLSHLRAVPILLPQTRDLHVVLVGCGGTGSWVAPTVARLARVLAEQGERRVRVTFVDPDVVEARNVFRQNFCDAEIGRYKAETLMQRFSAAWGVPITAVAAPFDLRALTRESYGLTVLVGCVDNAAARQALHHALHEQGDTAYIWWLDCGNGYAEGQVVLGSAPTLARLESAFRIPTVCAQLPSPALVHPNLLVAKPEELGGAGLSCEEILARNAQSLTVNQQVAAVAGHYLVELLLTGTLRRFATYFDLVSGSMRSRYITPEAVAAALGVSLERVFAEGGCRGGEADGEVWEEEMSAAITLPTAR